MLKKTITYTDYDGNERTEDFLFNLTKAELIELAHSEKGGLEKVIEKIIAEKDNKKIVGLFKEVIAMAYGEKSIDGKRFQKSPEISKSFMETEAYSILFMELLENEGAAIEFVNGLVPKA